MRIIFVRHGEPDYDNDCLTPTGKVQAQQAARRLLGEGIEQIWSSPYGRARETAQAFAEVSGLPVRILESMYELDWENPDAPPAFDDGNPWDTVDEMARLGQDLTDPAWRKNPYFRSSRVIESVERVEKGIDGWLAGLGYIRDGLYYRNTVEEKEHRTVALFSHGGSSSAAIGHMLNLQFPHMCALFHMEFTGITILRLNREVGRLMPPWLELVNDASHLR